MELLNHYIWSSLERIYYFTISTLCSGEGAGVTCDDREAAVVAKERSCFIRGISYHNQRSAVLGLTSPPTPTAAECQKACQGAVRCTHFTWLFLGGKCKLFRLLDVSGESVKT